MYEWENDADTSDEVPITVCEYGLHYYLNVDWFSI
jgi:hypothetical protein